MPQSLNNLIMHLKPYWLQAGSAAFGWEINKIIYLPLAGSAVTYDKTAANLTTALAGMAAGEIVQIHGPCTLADDFTIPANTCLMGIGPEINLAGTISTGSGSVGFNLNIAATANNANSLYGVTGPVVGSAYLFGCSISSIQSGSGNAYAVGAINGLLSGDGSLYIDDCLLYGSSVSGSGYGGRSIAGKLYVTGNTRGVYGSTDRFTLL